MQVVLHVGGNDHQGVRYEPSDEPQDVPDRFGKAMVGRGKATKVAAKKVAVKKQSASGASASKDDE